MSTPEKKGWTQFNKNLNLYRDAVFVSGGECKYVKIKKTCLAVSYGKMSPNVRNHKANYFNTIF